MSTTPALPRQALKRRTAPSPLPLGKRKQDGRSSMAIEVATMWHSSASLEGAITTMFGSEACGREVGVQDTPKAARAGPSPQREGSERGRGARGSHHVGDVEGAHVRRAVGADEAATVHGEANGQLLQGHIVDDLVVGPLHEGRVDGDHRDHALARQARRKRDGVLLGDADVKRPVGEVALEDVHA